MVESIVVKSVVDVISAIQETQRSDLDGFTSELHSGSNWIKHAFESCKRKIIEANGIEDERNKRRKPSSSSEATSCRNSSEVDKENNHPNVAINGSILKPAGKKEVAFSHYEKKGIENVNKIDVMSLKVVELRTHLRQRGLDATGLKKILQDRLQKALNDEVAANDADSCEQKNCVDEIKQEASKEEIIADGNKVPIVNGANVPPIEMKSSASTQSMVDAEMVDCSEENKETEQNNKEFVKDEDIDMIDPNLEIISKQSQGSVREISSDEVDNKHSQKKTFGQKFLKATRKVFSPNKNKNSPIKTKKLQSPDGALTGNTNKGSSFIDTTMTKVAQEHNRVTYEEPDQPPPNSNSNSLSVQNEDSKKNHSKRASMVCNMTMEEIKNAEIKSTSKESSSSDQKEKLVKVVQSTPALSKTNYNSSSSQKLRSMKEARKARLDEIRNKVHSNSKTLTQLTSSKNIVTSTSSGQKNTGKDAADRKRAIALQMRQKAAAAAAKQYTNSTVRSDTTQKQPQSPPTPDKPEPQQKEQKKQTVQQQEKVRSPMETYEMSDRGESDSEDSDYEDREPKKKIPKWAQRDNLRAALEKQFLDGPGKVDPDEIFPEVSTCDLEAIFDQRKKRYLKRTSSGNWTKDKVTITEKLVYKRNMGFKK